MKEKATAIITTQDGSVQTVSGDTVITFGVTLDKKENGIGLKSSIGYLGIGVPDELYETIIGNLIVNLVKSNHKNPIEANFKIYSIAEFLSDYSDKMIVDLPEDKVKAYLVEFLGNSLRDL